MVKRDEIIARVRRRLAAIAPALQAENLKEDEPLCTNAAFDSIALVSLALFLETEFGAKIKAADLTSGVFYNLGAIAELVATRRRAPL